MSFVTPADAAYIKDCVQRISRLSGHHSFLCCTDNSEGAGETLIKHDAELARLEAFIDGLTSTEKGKGSE